MDSRIVQIIIGIMAFIFIGVAVLIYLQFRPAPEIRYASDGDAEFTGSAVDSGARIEIEMLRAQIEALKGNVERLESELAALQSRSNTEPVPGQQTPGTLFRDGENDIKDAYAQVVLIANRRNLNKGLRIAPPSYLESVFGKPRATLSNTCQSMTNERLADKLVTEQVGPVRVRMLKPAIASLRRVFEQVQKTDPDLYERINTAGALCVRHIRGAPGRTSTHAFGLSLDLNIDGHLDQLGDGKTQLGLTILADFFKDEGWYWGAGFTREDSMHFEVSRDLVEKWIAEGLL
ncbi:MAG: M15 family peptidase [Rhodobacteraceae bacterium]|nr:M15 family peptidase [Paracoccaceae bacterium]